MAQRKSRKQLRRERDELRAKARKHRDAIAAKLAESAELHERIERKRRQKKRHRDDVERVEELEREIAALIEERRRVRERIDVLEPRLAKVRKRIRKIRRRLRNRVRPKIVDLRLGENAVRPLARQGALYGTVGHYTAGPTDDDDEEAFALWRAYDRAHKAQGWACLGYPWGITRDGTIVLLRGREWVGAHTLGHNTGWDGCSVHGTTGDTWTDAQLRSFRWALKHFGMDRKPVYGHREMPGQSTACPGDFLGGYKSKGKHR